ncbi:TonB-dependent receptor [Chitinophagaceae bacterium LB-8]|uniref:TonB-dependent receptor n=1 Tax=Paraflavisolibacter caeni TaxID=2982496 RepID=A0A9X2XTT0_9BACT|nr:TonB-dependent receptor [Paraflavisolibacter caeni]MCU7548307.1 TonB-dependent receptor [Paraflavisolibacter caeni]
MNIENSVKAFFCMIGLSNCNLTIAQVDTSRYAELKKVVVVGYKAMNGIGHFNEVNSSFVYTGKKTEIIEVDSIDANKAINNTRQILGRIPGLNIIESETGGFVANGIGIRGLNPVQSMELNVRQNGYNIAADVYGYNETYYLPPMEAVERVEMIKGASSLQFGSQLGGMVNYVIRQGSKDKPFSFSTMQTVGSAGLYNGYLSAGGSIGKLNYFSFINYRGLQGWRANSNQQQLTGFGKVKYQLKENLSFSLEYSLLRNKIKMPGGLTDTQFNENSRTSVRSRNWVKSPWNIVSANMDYMISKNTRLNVVTSFLSGERSLVWVNQLPDKADEKDPLTGVYTNREVDREVMKSTTTELRLLHHYKLGKIQNTLSAGMRFGFAKFDRMEEAPGTNNSDFDLSTQGEYEEQFKFTTINSAGFLENRIQLNDKFSINPGLRLESLITEAEGEFEAGSVEKEIEKEKERVFVLAGLGLQYQAGKNATVYANITQAYRPIDYAQLLPLSSVSEVDPDLKDPKGWNSDLGIRGNVKNLFNYDVSLFYLQYNNRIGLVLKENEAGESITYRTNIAQSIHKGVESYLECNVTRWLGLSNKIGNLSIYNSLAYTNAQYTRGEYKGNKVEYAPELINRVGFSYALKWFSTSLQYSHQSKAYGDAANTEISSNPVVGRIPAYSVIDWSVNGHWKNLKIKSGVNNLADKHYFTQRTDEYPGPGIIPSIGRSYYIGIGWDFR